MRAADGRCAPGRRTGGLRHRSDGRRSRRGMSACRCTQACMAIAAARPALIERVEPNCAMEHTIEARGARLLRQPGALLPEEQHARARQVGRSSGTEPAGCRSPMIGRPSPPPRRPGRRVGVVAHVLVAVGDHRAAPVPAATADDVDLLGEEGVGGADDRPMLKSWPSSRPRRGSRAGGCRGRRRSPRASSTGSGRPRCAGRRGRAAAPGRSARRRATAAGCGPTPIVGPKPSSYWAGSADPAGPRVRRTAGSPAGRARGSTATEGSGRVPGSSCRCEGTAPRLPPGSRQPVAQPGRRPGAEPPQEPVGRKTASAAIIASEKNGRPSRTAMQACSSIIATSSTFFTRRLNRVKGKATCTITVP